MNLVQAVSSHPLQPARWRLVVCDQMLHFVVGVFGVFHDPVGLLPEVLHRWQLCPGDVLSSSHHVRLRAISQSGYS